MVGRDIGTVVLPEADLKIYLDASVEARACRRWKERLDFGTKPDPTGTRTPDFEAVLVSMRRRDEIDSHRAVSPLRVADGAVIVDNTNLSIDETLAVLLHLVEERMCQEA
jgi:cytidylate kinase